MAQRGMPLRRAHLSFRCDRKKYFFPNPQTKTVDIFFIPRLLGAASYECNTAVPKVPQMVEELLASYPGVSLSRGHPCLYLQPK